MPVPALDTNLQEVIISNQHNPRLFSKLEQCLKSESDVSTRCSPPLMKALIQIIQRELKSNQYHNVNMVLTCIQHISSNANDERGLPVLLENGLPELLVYTYEEVIRSTSAYSLNQQQSPADICLLQLLETINDVADFGSASKENLARLFVEKLMVYIINHGRNFATRMEAIRTLNLLLEGCPAASLKHLQASPEIHKMLDKFAEFLPKCGDFEMQVACTETLARMVKKSDREAFCQRGFQNNDVAESFLEIRDACFEVDCRTFLNTLNKSQDHDNRVISIPCKEAFLGSYRLKCPQDEQLVDMWVDFNAISRSITIYVADDSSSPEESSMWETVTIPEDLVVKYEIKMVGDLQHLSMTLSVPASQILEFCNSDSCTALIMFAADRELRQPLALCFSQDKIQNQVRCKTSECSIKVLFKRMGEGGGILTENVYMGRNKPQETVHQKHEQPKSLLVPLKRAKISAPISPMTSRGHQTQQSSEQRRKPDVQPKTPQRHPPKRAKTPLNVIVADKMSGADKTTPGKSPARQASASEGTTNRVGESVSKKTPVRRASVGRKLEKLDVVESSDLNNSSGKLLDGEAMVNGDVSGKPAPRKTPTRRVSEGRRRKKSGDRRHQDIADEGCQLGRGDAELLNSDVDLTVENGHLNGDVSDGEMVVRGKASHSDEEHGCKRSSRKSSDGINQDQSEALPEDGDQADEIDELVIEENVEVSELEQGPTGGEPERGVVDMEDVWRRKQIQEEKDQSPTEIAESGERQATSGFAKTKDKNGHRNSEVEDRMGPERKDSDSGQTKGNGKGKSQRKPRKKKNGDGSKSDPGTSHRRSSRGQKEVASEKGSLSDWDSATVKPSDFLAEPRSKEASRGAQQSKNIPPGEPERDNDQGEEEEPNTAADTFGGPSISRRVQSAKVVGSVPMGIVNEKHNTSAEITDGATPKENSIMVDRELANEENILVEKLEHTSQGTLQKRSSPVENVDRPSNNAAAVPNEKSSRCVDSDASDYSQLVICETQEMVPLVDQRAAEEKRMGTRASQRLRPKKTGEQAKARKNPREAATTKGLDSLKPGKRKSTSGRFKLYSGATGLLEDDSHDSAIPSTYQSQDSMADFVPDSCPTQQNQHQSRFPDLSDIPERSTESTSSETEERKKPKRPRKKPKAKPRSKQNDKKMQSKPSKNDNNTYSESSSLHKTREFLSTSLPALAPEEESADPYLFSDIKDSGKKSSSADEKALKTKPKSTKSKRPNLNVPDKESFLLKKSFMTFPSKSLTSTSVVESSLSITTGGGDNKASSESAAVDTVEDEPGTKTRKKRMLKRQKKNKKGHQEGNAVEEMRGQQDGELEVDKKDQRAVAESVEEDDETSGEKEPATSSGKLGKSKRAEEMAASEMREETAEMSCKKGGPSGEGYEDKRPKTQNGAKQKGRHGTDKEDGVGSGHLGEVNASGSEEDVPTMEEAKERSQSDNIHDKTTRRKSGKLEPLKEGRKNKETVRNQKRPGGSRQRERLACGGKSSQDTQLESGEGSNTGEVDRGRGSSPDRESDNISDVELVISQYNSPRWDGDEIPAEEPDGDKKDDREREQKTPTATPDAGGDAVSGVGSKPGSGMAAKSRSFSWDVQNVSDIEVMRDAASITDPFKDDEIQGYLSSLKQFLGPSGTPRGKRKKNDGEKENDGEARARDQSDREIVGEADGQEITKGRKRKKSLGKRNVDEAGTDDGDNLVGEESGQEKPEQQERKERCERRSVGEARLQNEDLKGDNFVRKEASHEGQSRKTRQESSEMSSTDHKKRNRRKDRHNLSGVSSDENIADEMDEINQELMALSRELQGSKKRRNSGGWRRGEEDHASEKSYSSRSRRPKEARTPASAAEGSRYGSEIEDDEGEVSDVNLDLDEAKTDASVASFSKICESIVCDSVQGIAKSRSRRHVPKVDYRDKDTSYSDEDFNPLAEKEETTSPSSEMETESPPMAARSCISNVSDLQSEKSWLLEKSHMKVSTYSKIQRTDWTKGKREDVFKTIQKKTTTHRKRERLESDNFVPELFAPKKRRKKDMSPEVDQDNLYYVQGNDDNNNELGEEQRNVQRVLSKGPQMESTPNVSLLSKSSSRRIYMKHAIPGSAAHSSFLGKKSTSSVVSKLEARKHAKPRLSYSPNLPRPTERDIASVSRQRALEGLDTQQHSHSEFLPREIRTSLTSEDGRAKSAQSSHHLKTSKTSPTAGEMSRSHGGEMSTASTPQSQRSGTSEVSGVNSVCHSQGPLKQDIPRSHRSRKSGRSHPPGGEQELKEGMADPSQVTSTLALEPDSQGITTDGDAAGDSDSSIVDENSYFSGPANVKEVSRSTLRRKYQHLIDDITKGQVLEEENDEPEVATSNLPPAVSRKPINPRRLFEEELKKREMEEEEELNDIGDLDDEDDDDEEVASIGDPSSSGPSLWKYPSEGSSFQITDMMAMLGQRIQKQMAEKKQQAKLVTDSALRATQSHVNKIWINQNKKRVAAHQQFTESLIDEIVGLEMEISTLMKTSEKMQALLRRNKTAIDSKYSKALKTLHENHMKEMTELDDCLGRNLKKSVRAIMGQELASMRNRIVGDLQMQDMNQMRVAMQSFFDISMDSSL